MFLWQRFSYVSLPPLSHSSRSISRMQDTAAAGVSAPMAPAAISVRPSGDDDTGLLQGALDHVSRLPLREDGFRGAVLLRPGRYRVTGRLEIRTSGVVLRGSGNATIVATGKGRRTPADRDRQHGRPGQPGRRFAS